MLEKTHDHRLAHAIGMQTRHAPERIDRSSTKKDWDAFQGELREHPFPEPDPPRGDGMRHVRRLRRRDSAATARKSRKKAFRQAHAERVNNENLRGMARVYLGLVPANDAMDENVGVAVMSFADKLADERGLDSSEETLKEVETMLADIAKAYGDDLNVSVA